MDITFSIPPRLIWHAFPTTLHFSELVFLFMNCRGRGKGHSANEVCDLLEPGRANNGIRIVRDSGG